MAQKVERSCSHGASRPALRESEEAHDLLSLDLPPDCGEDYSRALVRLARENSVGVLKVDPEQDEAFELERATEAPNRDQRGALERWEWEGGSWGLYDDELEVSVSVMSTSRQPFDEHAYQYDTWFLRNRNVLESEVLLLRHFLSDPGRVLSVGCGSGLFEHILRTEHGIDIRFGVEPAEGMARIAEKRGLKVEHGTAEEIPFGAEEFDTVLLNGIPGYVEDLERAFREAHRVLKRGGRIVVADVPAESGYGLLYQLAGHHQTWDDPYLAKVAPAHPYPVEFVKDVKWRTTEEKARLLASVGFEDLEYAQTLTRHPKYSDDSVEGPVEGFDRGDYVAIRGRKPVS